MNPNRDEALFALAREKPVADQNGTLHRRVALKLIKLSG